MMKYAKLRNITEKKTIQFLHVEDYNQLENLVHLILWIINSINKWHNMQTKFNLICLNIVHLHNIE